MPLPAYRIERTKNRASRASFQEDVIVIRLAKNLQPTEEQRHIDVLLQRMTKIQTKLLRMSRVDPFRPLLDGQTVHRVQLSDGSSLTFHVSIAKRTRMRKTLKGWNIEYTEHTSTKDIHRLLWKALSQSEAHRLHTLVETINQKTLQVPIKKIGVRITSSRFGSCSTDGSINLSAALFFIPLHLVEYVIVHELCHRLHHNHSAAFWNAVENLMPDYSARVKELKLFRLPAL